MRRREFIAVAGGLLLARPTDGWAQQAPVPVIGFLRTGQPPKTWVEAFQQGLRERGYIDGQNVIVEFRLTDDSGDQLQRLAEELVRLKVDVILASAAPAALAAKKATTSVPIVFVGVFLPVDIGLVPSLGRPGGNTTGVANNAADLGGKRMELLRELIPTLRRVSMLSHPTHPTNQLQLDGAEASARALGLQLEPVPVQGQNDLDAAFKLSRRADGMLQIDSPLFVSHGARLVELAATNRLPAIYPFRDFVEAGGLMSYGPHFPDLYRRAAAYVAKILKGAKPADLPIEQPTKFELVIDLKTAKVLGITIPPTVIARADEVIE